MSRGTKREKTIAEVIAKRRERLATRALRRSLFRRACLFGLAGYLLFTYVFLIAQVSGQEMFPALKDGDLAIVFRMQDEYARNDVVAYSIDGQRHFGRIIARGSDVVTLDESGTLLVNGTVQSGEILYPTYAKEALTYPYRVPEGGVYILGDYRTQAKDSRDFGGIPLENVEGKVITILRRRGL